MSNRYTDISEHPPPIARDDVGSAKKTTDEDADDSARKKTWSRDQVVPCILIYAGMVSMVICIMMMGPSLLDLLQIADTSIKQGSWFIAARAIGALLGSIVLSKTMDSPHFWHQMTATLFLAGIAFIIVPWVNVFAAMVFLFIIVGFGNGYMFTGGMLSLLSIWPDKKDGVSWLNGGQLMLVLGGMFGPLIVWPFLSKQDIPATNSTFGNSTEDIFLQGISDGISQIYMEQNATEILPQYGKTRIKYAYLIGGGIAILAGIFLVVAYYALGSIRFTVKNPTKGGPKTQMRLLHLKFGIGLLLFIFHVFTAVIVRTFSSYILTFTVTYLGWTKMDGTLLTSVVLMAALVGKVMCIYLVRVMKTEYQLFSGLIINIVGSVLLMIFVNFHKGVIWVCSVIIAIGDANITGTILPWTNNYIGIKGIIGALYSIGGTIGEIISSPLVGWFFSVEYYEAFLYLLAGCSICNFIIMVCLQPMGMRYQYLSEVYSDEENEQAKEQTPLVRD